MTFIQSIYEGTDVLEFENCLFLGADTGGFARDFYFLFDFSFDFFLFRHGGGFAGDFVAARWLVAPAHA